jgi:NAD-dependent dihydropyrimidine dehydrogenase PreA subunit
MAVSMNPDTQPESKKPFRNLYERSDITGSIRKPLSAVPFGPAGQLSGVYIRFHKAAAITAGIQTMEVSWSSTVQFEVYIDPERCGKSCVCVDMCSMGVFAKVNGDVFPVNSHLCCSCFKCNEFCPHHAISTRWILRA